MGDKNMDYKSLIKNNLKFVVSLVIVLVLGIVGVTFALDYSASSSVNINTAELGASITYLNGSSASIVSTGDLIPINDSTNDITPDTLSNNVLKISFKVQGNTTNPNNTIMDISLNDISMDCELKSTYFKWKLYRDDNLISDGNFSMTFDEALNNRIVLTNTQEDLPNASNNDTLSIYTLLMYIADSCSGDIGECNSTYDQKRLLGKSFSAIMKLELSTGKKKPISRSISTINDACNYGTSIIPTCNSVSYDGTNKVLVSEGTGYTLSNNIGNVAGNYAVIAKLNDGYKWADDSVSDKVMNCSIDKKELTITASNQTISSGSSLSSLTSNVVTEGLVSGHKINKVYLYTPQYEKGTGVIYANGAQIVDSSGNDMTNNYQINYVNGTVTIE